MKEINSLTFFRNYRFCYLEFSIFQNSAVNEVKKTMHGDIRKAGCSTLRLFQCLSSFKHL